MSNLRVQLPMVIELKVSFPLGKSHSGLIDPEYSNARLLYPQRVVRVRQVNGRYSLAKTLMSACFFISITGSMASFTHLAAQEVTSAAPPAETGVERYPDALPIAPADEGTPIQMESETQSKKGSVTILDGDAVVTYGDRTLYADHIEYDSATDDVTLTGHLLVTGGENDERIQASHGTINVRNQAGRFYDVTGSVGLRQSPAAGAMGVSQSKVYANGNPFLFSGRLVVKTGPKEYQIYGGTVTSCQLPNPDWLLSASEFSVDGDKAHATNSIFHVMNFPLLWLPYVTHPVDTDERQSGFLIPVLGDSSSKGLTVGEQIYWSINRSTDLTVGTIYYSDRGWEQSASYHYRGLGDDMVRARYSGLQDRGYTPVGGTYTNQSGEDVTFSARRDYLSDSDSGNTETPSTQTRTAADVEYLSSFLYREAFSTNFNQAVSSDVVSTVYGTHEWDGMALSLEGDRYQGEKRVATAVLPEEQVHIFHAPAVEFTTVDQGLGNTGLEWNVDSSVAMLKRVQPNFETGGMIERLDVRPELAFPFGAGGWRMRPSVATRETFYSRSRFPAGTVTGTGVESLATLNRSDVEVQLDLRPPVLERTFDSGFVKRLLRHDVKHTIEPELTYRYVNGINNFQNVLRFDGVDVASNTNEFEYGATQRLFLRRTGTQKCHTPGSQADAIELLGGGEGSESNAVEDPGEATGRTDDVEPVCGNREWINWQVAQKYFIEPTFGGAVVDGRRNILATTLDFSGIAFLTEPRNISPLISRLRVRTSEKTDVEWDFDYDTGARKFTANNIYADVHQGNVFAGVSYARLNAPGRSYIAGVASSVADFSQMRTTLGFGRPTMAGLSVATNAGIDLDLGTVQYGAIQTSYNWNCCGVSVEYRKYELGTARNENVYRFNFTLANIGSAGNIRHSDQVF
jgi:LPS-assembly protein